MSTLFSEIANKLRGVSVPSSTPTSKAPASRRATDPPDMPAYHEAHVYQQEAFRAGLLVTDELDKAIARCKAKVAELAEECRSRNRRFRYEPFCLEKFEPLTNLSL